MRRGEGATSYRGGMGSEKGVYEDLSAPYI